MKRIRYPECVVCFDSLSGKQYAYCSQACEKKDKRDKKRIGGCCQEPGCTNQAERKKLCGLCLDNHDLCSNDVETEDHRKHRQRIRKRKRRMKP